MKIELIEVADASYQRAEERAGEYFAALKAQLHERSYVPGLIEDIGQWKRRHIHRAPLPFLFARTRKKPDPSDVQTYLRWLNRSGKLDAYLERSVSYIYMRDLGKDLNDPRTRKRLEHFLADLKKLFLSPAESAGGNLPELLSLRSFYRWAEKEGVEGAAIWLIDKLKGVSAHLPKEMNAEEAQRKLIKIILGVVLHALDEISEEAPAAKRAQILEAAIKSGYYYGLTYPFIDDLLDSEALNADEKERYSRMIRAALISGTVPEPGEWSGGQRELMRYVYTELREAYEYIKSRQPAEAQRTFFDQSYVFFHAQHVDRVKELAHADYSNEELYLPIILKSSSSRLIVRSVIGAPQDEGFDRRVFYYGLYNQLADDFADLSEDMERGAVTPYTYYYKYRHQRPDLINPFELYWAVIFHLIHHVYRSDAAVREILLDRAINGLKRYRKRAGQAKYEEVMEIFSTGSPELNRFIERMVHKAEDVDFLDKLLRDQLLAVMNRHRSEQEQFAEIIHTARLAINKRLPLSKPGAAAPPMQELLIETANYCLEGSGKRLRPILAWVMGVNEFGLPDAGLTPLLRALEYMHTASLIFDDLPSQDNSSIRRGRPTLHRVHNSAIAELTGIFLIQKAIEEVSSLEGFPGGAVLALLKYMSQKAGEICMGQAMDLSSRGKALTLDELNQICFYKTGIAFEVSLAAPAILAGADEADINVLKTYSYHAGIAFQIKDDLLDWEGDLKQLGKPTGQDKDNENSTFVAILGLEGARKQMWEHYCLAEEALKELPRGTVFLRHLLHFIVGRDR
ncbi:polyprenyl synthetase family protein [Paenibacillus macerans]|uniref:Polyprenyl synthetase family protein n=1 Tax=Paenibacillus macerans TaxID=44252 RepID=A0A090ZJF0_PAEMA|nr:polyprenyl synthetase family protein [Paenibacillus macerans]KFN10747.1 polyprenyl synthetase family protein [Paenibacillus macerans]MBS5914088.1 polyprenyl synthetase family protein [Paenibacillus macerans]MCY7561743.1 polyprenyl synthetase family protein [Paenibacillus macerans]MEC0153133.1 polyprenyl synthetase family protein [Paenibacillus macerans]SUA83167.1 geranyltranstransferase [Paenibacillus macerans]